MSVWYKLLRWKLEARNRKEEVCKRDTGEPIGRSKHEAIKRGAVCNFRKILMSFYWRFRKVIWGIKFSLLFSMRHFSIEGFEGGKCFKKALLWQCLAAGQNVYDFRGTIMTFMAPRNILFMISLCIYMHIAIS